MNAFNPTPDVSSRYGAPMGRRSSSIDFAARLYLRRIRVNSGGYDDGGAYWGIGAPLFAYGDGDDTRYLRAHDREAAKRIIRNDLADIEPGQVRFYR